MWEIIPLLPVLKAILLDKAVEETCTSSHRLYKDISRASIPVTTFESSHKCEIL
jgi:hypothetical protein